MSKRKRASAKGRRRSGSAHHSSPPALQRSGLQAAFDRNIRTRQLLRDRQHIVVAVSGGLDSMVLLDLLHRCSKARGLRLTVAHFNHQLRGRSSDADERLVRRKAKKLGLPFTVDRADVRQFALKNKLSIEMA